MGVRLVIMKIDYPNFFVNFLEVLKSFLLQIKRFCKLQYPSRIALVILRFRRRKQPRTFNEKILYKIAFDRSANLTLYADKLKVREFVASRIGDEYLTEIYTTGRSSRDLSLSTFPRTFALKPNHASGAALIVADFVPESLHPMNVSKKFFRKYYINPKSLSDFPFEKLVDFWMSTSYFGYCRSGYPEWAYKNIERFVYMEELLHDGGAPPQDFRFFMFNGKCEAIMVDTPGYVGVRRDIYSPEWTRLNVTLGYANSEKIRESPSKLPEMIQIAEALSSDSDHLRVDLYLTQDRIIFGELTNYHAGGTQRFEPKEFDFKLGSSWQPSEHY